VDFTNLPLHELAAWVNSNPDLLDEMPKDFSTQCSKSQNLQIFISFNPHNLFQDVVGVKETLRQGKELPLAGATVALADNICTMDSVTTCASGMLSTYKHPFQARLVEKLQAKGAFMVGKTNMEEFGLGASGGSSHFGETKNPWDPSRSAGHGAAAATATLVTLALASDACGEARQSATYCGVVSLKPSYGRISRKGVIDYAPSLAQPGIMARSVRDLALALEHTAGDDPADPTTLQIPVPAYTSLLNQDKKQTFRVAVLENWDEAPGLEEKVRDAFEGQLASLKNAGLEIESVPLKSFQEAYLAAAVISAVEAFSSLANFDGVRFGLRGEGKSLQEMYISTRTEGFSSKIKEFLTFGALVSNEEYYQDYYLKSQKMRARLKQELRTCLEQYDLLLTPAVPFAAPLLAESRGSWPLPDPACYFTAAANLSGLPALTFPAYAAPGLPAGLQLMGRFGDETTLLQAALRIEKENPLQLPEHEQGFNDQGVC